MNEDISRICKICLAVNLKIFVIKNEQLTALYKNIICTQLDFDLVQDYGVEIGACYICYTQLLKILKFSKLAQTSGKRLQYLKDIGTKISKRSIGFSNERSQHNLSITVIPPISLQSTAKITEGTVLSYPAVSVKNEIDHKNNTDDDCQKSNNYMINHPRPTLPLATISLTQRPMKIETLVGIKTILEKCTLNKPIDEYFVNVKEEYIELDHNIADECQKSHYYNKMIEHPTLNLPLATISLTQRSMQTETLVGTKTIQDKCALNKPINEDFMSDLRNVTEEYVENEHNTTDDFQKRNNYVIRYPILTVQPSTKSLLKSSNQTETFTGTNNIQENTLSKQITEDHVVSLEKHNDYNIGENCEKSKACVNDHTLTMSPANSSPQSSKQTKPLVGTKRKTLDLDNLLKLKKGKTNASEFKFENDTALTNTPFKRNDRKLALTKKINQTKNKIEELIQKLIEIHTEVMIKNKNVNSQKPPYWCDRSQLLLIQLIQQAGSEWAGSMLLTGRVFPLFPQGFLRVPSLTELIRMAGYKTYTVPSELYLKQRKYHKVKSHYYNKMIEHPTLNLPLATISLTQRSMQTETLVGTKTIQDKCALNKPINEDFMSDLRNVTEEYVENEHNTTDDFQKRNNYVIRYPILTVQPSTKSLLKSSNRTETFTGTNNIQENTLSKQITEDHVVSLEKHNNYNIVENCEKSKACVNDHTLTMSPANSSPQSSKQTKPLVGTKRKTLDLNNLLKLKKGKTNASELQFENDTAVTNTPFKRNELELALTKKINQSKNKIEELIQKLIEIHTEAMIKNKNVNSQKPPHWCDRSQLLLIQLIQQAGSEWAGSMLLAGRVFPLFPQGFLRVPSLTELIRMAGYKTNTGPSELYLKQRKYHKVESKKSTSVKSVNKKLSTSIDNQGRSVLFSQSTKFPLSNVLEIESKRDIQSFIPVKIKLKDTIITSKDTGISESDGKQPPSNGNETNNEIKLNNAASSSVPKKTSSMNKSQEQIAVKFDNDNEIKQNNAIFFRTNKNASKFLQSTVSSFVPKETNNLSKSQEQNIVNIENHGRISSKRINKEQLKSTEPPKQAHIDDKKTIAAPKETDSVLEAMLNKFSKLKKKLDSQNRDDNLR